MNTNNIQPKPLNPEKRQKLYDESYAYAYAEARSKVLSEENAMAYAQSYAENYVYGYALGMAKADYEIARRMKAKGFSVGDIADVTDLLIEEIETI